MVKELTSSNWCENVDGAKELSVVFFYANWCRNCKAVMPVFKRLELGLGLGCTGLILTLPLTLTLTLTLTLSSCYPSRGFHAAAAAARAWRRYRGDIGEI